MPKAEKTKPTQSKSEALLRQRKPVGYALLAAALGVLAFLFLRQGSSANLAQRVPENVSVFVEAPSVSKLLAALGKSKIGDAETGVKQTADASAGAVAAAFHLTHDDAAVLERSVVAVAFAGRVSRVSRVSGGTFASAWLVAVSSAASVEPLLASNRLTVGDALGQGGAAYRIAPSTAAALQTSDMPALERWLRGLATKDDGKVLGWFPEARLLAVGDDALLRDIGAVVDSGKGTLDGKDAWKRLTQEANAAGAADGFLFADEQALKDFAPFADQKKALEGFVHDGGIVSGSFQVGPAGLLVRGSVPLSGDGAWRGKGIASAAKLTFPARLPAETALYVAASLHHDLDENELKERVAKTAAAAEGVATVAGAELSHPLEDLEKALGVPFDDLWKSTGEEAVLALVLGKDFKYSANAPMLREALKGAGAVFAMKVDSDVSALRTLNRLHEAFALSEMGRLADVSPDGPGFVAIPRVGANAKLVGLIGGSLPTLRVRYKKKEIVAVLASKEIEEVIFAALDGGGDTLAKEAAHTRAIATLRPDAHVVSWVDLGRIATLVYAANPGARVDAKGRGWPVDAVTLTGPNRVTQAFDLHFRADPSTFTVDAEALNPWGPALVSGWLMSVPGARPPGIEPPPRPVASGAPSAAPSPAASAPLGLGDPLESMPTCKQVLSRLKQCEDAATAPDVKDAFVKQEADLRARVAKAPAARWQFENVACAGPFFKLTRDPNCPPTGLVPVQAPR